MLYSKLILLRQAGAPSRYAPSRESWLSHCSRALVGAAKDRTQASCMRKWTQSLSYSYLDFEFGHFITSKIISILFCRQSTPADSILAFWPKKWHHQKTVFAHVYDSKKIQFNRMSDIWDFASDKK